jgi:hypothetical protein
MRECEVKTDDDELISGLPDVLIYTISTTALPSLSRSRSRDLNSMSWVETNDRRYVWPICKAGSGLCL